LRRNSGNAQKTQVAFRPISEREALGLALSVTTSIEQVAEQLTGHPGSAPADGTACLAVRRRPHADTVYAVHAGTARLADLDDGVARLLDASGRNRPCR
jgi:hypothetical protein